MDNSYVDDFLAGLEDDRYKPRDNGDSIKKLTMESPDNQGIAIIAPFPFSDLKKFYMMIQGVKEYRGTCSSYKQGQTAAWLKVLPKAMYGELTDEQSALYDEVSGYFDALYQKMKSKKDAYKMIRIHRYSIFQGIVLKQTKTDNKVVDATKGKAAVLIYPTSGLIDELAKATNAKINEFNGSREWIPMVLRNTAGGREGVMSLSFIKNKDKAGYAQGISFGFNSSFSKVINDDQISEEEVKKLVNNPLPIFLAWQYGKDSAFNDKLFVELRDQLKAKLAIKDAKPEDTPALKNENGKDPMTDAPEPAETRSPDASETGGEAPTPTPEPSPEPAAEKKETDSKGRKMPF